MIRLCLEISKLSLRSPSGLLVDRHDTMISAFGTTSLVTFTDAMKASLTQILEGLNILFYLVATWFGETLILLRSE